jgi:hypothetical protein
LLSIVFILLHVGVLAVDRYLPYSAWQILVPFLSPYRPFWVGIGVLAFYITLLVTVTFYLRNRIGMRLFRLIHVLSLVGYLGVTLHGLYAGTDRPTAAILPIYLREMGATPLIDEQREVELARELQEGREKLARVVLRLPAYCREYVLEGDLGGPRRGREWPLDQLEACSARLSRSANQGVTQPRVCVRNRIETSLPLAL